MTQIKTTIPDPNIFLEGDKEAWQEWLSAQDEQVRQAFEEYQAQLPAYLDPNAVPDKDTFDRVLADYGRLHEITFVQTANQRMGGAGLLTSSSGRDFYQRGVGTRQPVTQSTATQSSASDKSHSPRAAFERVKAWQLSLYDKQIKHIEALTQDSGQGHGEVAVYLFAAFLRGYCVVSTDVHHKGEPGYAKDQGVKNLNSLIAKMIGVNPSGHTNRMASELANEFIKLLGQVEVAGGYDLNDVEGRLMLREQYKQASVPVGIQGFDFFKLSEFEQGFVWEIAKDVPLEFDECMSSIFQLAGCEEVCDSLESTKSDLYAFREMAIRNDDPYSIVDVIGLFHATEVQEYLYEEIVGCPVELIAQARTGQMPEGTSLMQWRLAQFIVRAQDTQNSRNKGFWKDYCEYVSTVEDFRNYLDSTNGFLDAIWPLEYYLEGMRGVYRTAVAHVEDDPSDSYVSTMLQEGGAVEPEYVTVPEPAASEMPLAETPHTKSNEQLEILKGTITPIYESSVTALESLLKTRETASGKVPEYMAHLFKLALVDYAHFTNKTKPMKDTDVVGGDHPFPHLQGFLNVIYGIDGPTVQIGNFFFELFQKLKIDGVGVKNWAQDNRFQIPAGLDSLVTLPNTYDAFVEKIFNQNPNLLSRMAFVSEQDPEIRSQYFIDYGYSLCPVSQVENALVRARDKTNEVIGDIQSLHGPNAAFVLIDQYCPSQEGKTYLAAQLGVDWQTIGATRKPSGMSDTQWDATNDFSRRYQDYSSVESTSQMVGMGLFVFACMACAFVSPSLGMAAMAAASVPVGIDIHHEAEAFDRAHVAAVASEQDGVIQLADHQNLWTARQNLSDSRWNGLVTMASILSGVQMASSLRASVSNRAFRLLADGLFSASDAATAALADGRVHRSGQAEQAALIAAIFGGTGAVVGDVAGGMAAARHAGQSSLPMPRTRGNAGGEVVPLRRSFTGEYTKTPEGLAAIVFEVEGRPVVIDLGMPDQVAGGMSLPKNRDGHAILASVGDMDIVIKSVDPVTGRVELEAQHYGEWRPTVAEAEQGAPLPRQEGATREGQASSDSMVSDARVARFQELEGNYASRQEAEVGPEGLEVDVRLRVQSDDNVSGQPFRTELVDDVVGDSPIVQWGLTNLDGYSSASGRHIDYRVFHGEVYAVEQFNIGSYNDRIKFLTDNIHGLTVDQAKYLLSRLETAKGTYIFGGSRVKYTTRTDGLGRVLSDMDIGFDRNFSNGQRNKTVNKFNEKFTGSSQKDKGNPNIIEHEWIYPGAKPRDIDPIETPQEFFMRDGVRHDGRMNGENFEGSGYISIDSQGNVEVLMIDPGWRFADTDV